MSFLSSVKLSSGSEVKMQNSGYGIKTDFCHFWFFFSIFHFPFFPLLVSMVQVRVL